jgi:hypothetical protein
MSAIRIAQPPRLIVILREEKRSVIAVSSVRAELLIHGSQEPLRLVRRNRALTPPTGLKIGHQQGGRDSFTGDIADHESEPSFAELKEIVVVSSHVPRP